MSLAPGDHLDRFRIEALLGQGGMGAVYQAYDARLQRRVALKVLLLDDGRDEDGEATLDAKARLLREARAAAAIAHPNAVAIYDVGEHQDVAYIAMELIDGATLRAHVGSRELPLATRLRWLLQIAQALAAAHGSGLVHRDVKPENVLIRRDEIGPGTVKVLDFGIARRLAAAPSEGAIVPSPRAHSEPPPPPSSRSLDAGAPTVASGRGTLTMAGGAVGTPRYMAPEQLRAQPVDGRADQFAWGVVAYELLTGKLPWDEDTKNPIAFMQRILTFEPPTIDAIEPTIPADFGALVARAMAKAPEDRYPSMRALVAELEPIVARETSLASGEPTPLARTTAKSTVAAPTPRLAPVALAAIALVALVAFVGVRARSKSGAAPIASAPASTSASTSSSVEPDDAPPATTKEALAAYGRARTAMRQGAASLALTQLREATRLDPALAAAHLRIAELVVEGDAEVARAAYAKAAAGRASLSPRDRAILDADTPLFASAPPDLTEWSLRWKKLAESRPNDAEVAMGSARAAQVLGDFDGSLALYRRALALDPENGEARSYVVEMLAYLGRWDEALRAADECLARDPLATSCLAERSYISRQRGDCAAMEADARRWIQLTPDGPRGYRVLSHALAAEERPTAAVAEAIEQYAARAGSPSATTTTRLRWLAPLQVRDGDFTAARATLDALRTASRDSADRSIHAAIADLAAAMALETGDRAGARAIAVDFLARREAWLGSIFPDDGNLLLDPTGRMLAIARDQEAIDATTFRARRDAWLGEWAELRGDHRNAVWIAGFAELARDEADARAALAKLPEFGEPKGMLAYVRAMPFPARVRMLAGKPADAIATLRDAAASCDLLIDPITHQHATMWLGEALEATGDRAGACDAYARVLRRWGAAKPRSVTADAARAREAALHCR